MLRAAESCEMRWRHGNTLEKLIVYQATAMGHGGKRPGAGRPKGSCSRATQEQKMTIESLARAHSEGAINTLVALMSEGKLDSVKVSAAIALLDRGYGRPPQAHEIGGPDGGGIPIARIERVIIEPKRDREG